jgi:hypothetical protein
MTLAGRALAAAGGGDFFSAWMRAAETNYQPKFFTPAEFGVLASFTEILIPSDSTPGAREAQVAQYIDFVVNAAAEYAPETQQDWRTAIDWLMAAKFGALSSQEKQALVEQMAAPERDRSLRHDGFAAYRLIKQMTVFAFYTSKAGLVDNLEYKGNAYLTDFPGCTHPEHRRV